jgi:hypothetical protein
MSQVQLPSDADISGRDFGEEEIELLRQVIESGTLNCTKGTQVKGLREGVRRALRDAAFAGGDLRHGAVHTPSPRSTRNPATRSSPPPITDMGHRADPLPAGDPHLRRRRPGDAQRDAGDRRERITPAYRAIIATHLFGNPCDVVGIREVADAAGIPVIEDCAQAYLATQTEASSDDRPIGAFSLQQGST